jgi:hypothetical protein
MAQHDDGFEQADRSRCIIERLKAALLPGGASERPDSPPGEITRVLSLWPTQSYGDRLEWIEAMDRATVLAVYEHTLEHMVAPKVIEV